MQRPRLSKALGSERAFSVAVERVRDRIREKRVNIDTLGISELKWSGMGEFNSDDHYIYYCRQGAFRRKGVAIIVSKRV